MDLKILMVEGPHDGAFISKVMQVNGYKTYKKPIGSYSPQFVAKYLIGQYKNAPVDELNLQSVRQQIIFPSYSLVLEEKEMLLIFQMGGDGREDKRKKLVGDIYGFLRSTITMEELADSGKITFVYEFDADEDGVDARLQQVTREIKQIDFAFPGLTANASYVESNGIRWGSYIFENGSGKGKLEDIILPMIRERLKNRELQRCIVNDTFGSLMGNKKNFSAGLKQMYPQSPSLIKDRAFVDFLSLPEKHSERQLHKGLLDHMKQFVLELGKDFLYVDSEYPLQVGGSTFKVDLLFYHRGLQCLVAIELKAKKFKPEYMGQLEFYLEALDRDVKRSNENPSIGILLCQSADQSVVEYAMSRSLSPTMVAEYHRQLIPKEVVQKSLEEFCSFLKEFKEK